MFYADYQEGPGAPPFDSRLMLRVLPLTLLGYTTGVRSSRKLEETCWDKVALRLLAGGQAPAYRVIGKFRKRRLSALGQLFVQALELCQAAGMVSLGKVALDGTKVQASVSRRKAMSYARMTHKPKVLAAEVSDLLGRPSGSIRTRSRSSARATAATGCLMSWPATRASSRRSPRRKRRWRQKPPSALLRRLPSGPAPPARMRTRLPNGPPQQPTGRSRNRRRNVTSPTRTRRS